MELFSHLDAASLSAGASSHCLSLKKPPRGDTPHALFGRRASPILKCRLWNFTTSAPLRQTSSRRDALRKQLRVLSEQYFHRESRPAARSTMTVDRLK
jgi:hypothetical protein